SAEGLAHAPVPARRRQGDPGGGADAGRRRRCALRHLRRPAREGEGGRRDDRQVERPARARRALRPRRRDVPRAHRRRDPERRARGAQDRRGDRRVARRRGPRGAETGVSVVALGRGAAARIEFRGVLPLALMTTLVLAVGAYAAVNKDAFLTSYNLRNLLLATMPLALVSLGQTSALLVGGFDVSVAAVMTMCVVTASFTLTSGMSTAALVPGALALVGVGLATGLFNAVLVRVFRLPSIVATLGTLSILEGASL